VLEMLPPDVREGLALARRHNLKRKVRLRVHFGDAVVPVLRLWDDGMALDAEQILHLRGLADIYDGSRHIFQALIYASAVEGGELVCSFKRSNVVSEQRPLDYWRDEHAPVGYLPKA
jgi:hypothetical protein